MRGKQIWTREHRNKELYYYDTSRGFTSEVFAGNFLNLLLEEMKRQKKTEILFLCIGTDRSTGDSLGPLIGHKLVHAGISNATVLGTLDYPVHALNLEYCLSRVQNIFSNAIVVAVDASIGNVEHIGYITLGRGALKPGLGVRKQLSEVGDICITGIVGSSKCGDPLILQSVRLSIVMRLAECISDSLILGMKTVETCVENYCLKSVLF